MALVNTERLPKPINIDSLAGFIRGLVRLNETSAVIPWKSIFQSGINHDVINGTVGSYFRFRAALDFPMPSEKGHAVKIWRQETKRDLLNYLDQVSQSRRVIESLRQTSMFTTDPKETFTEKCLRITTNIIKGRDRYIGRLMKGGA